MSTASMRGPEIERQQPQLFIAPNRGIHLGGLLGRLAARLELDSHDTILLTRSAATAMKYIALLLAINFFFDLGTWWLLLNSVLGGGTLGLHPHSFMAFIGALLISLAILVYEQQFMTADTTVKRSRWIPAIALRLAVVFGSAVVTSQAVELIFFKGPINNRIHDESVYKEAITRLKSYETAQSMQTESEYVKTPEYINLEDRRKLMETAREEMYNAEIRLNAARANLSAARGRAARIAARMRNATGTQYRILQRQLQAANAAAGRYDAAVQAGTQELERRERTVNDLRIELEGFDEKFTALLKDARGDQERLEEWISLVRNAPPGTQVKEPGDNMTGWTFQDQQYDFFNQLRVLSDLTNGRPARWPADARVEDIEELANTFKFKGVSQQDQESEQINRLIDAEFYTRSYWAVFIIALVIPTLMLAFKLLQPQGLRDYYSGIKQAQAGNYGAVQFIVKTPYAQEAGD